MENEIENLSRTRGFSREELDADFTAFVAANGGRLIHIAELLSGEPHRAADLAQAALEKAYPRWNRIRSDNPMAYIRTILVNQHKTWWRRYRDREQLGNVPERATAYDFAHEHSQRMVVLDALAKLTKRERQVVVLRYYADLSEAQTAAELGISQGTVKSTMHRALARLRGSQVLTLLYSDRKS
ncbi:SigE family RNA polymerase sigma factor [Catenulispora rubra]|uniref:SigE family RNA polymerase sigma factor n=1 Tax=Catenulispora rubra TaxID=280293 RepID=UPI002B277138|nr:SigE family RNA polymerase sigma factor [Catenulispora rubra]